MKLLGSILNLKPLVKIDHEDGIVEAAGRARTFKQGIEMLMERFFEELDTSQALRIAVLHGDTEEQAQNIAHRTE